MQQTSNDLIFGLCTHLFLKVLKAIIVAQFSVDIRLASVETVTAFDFELLLFKELALTFLDLEIKEAVRLTRPCDRPDVDFGHFNFYIHGLGRGHLLKSARILVRGISCTSLNHFALA